MHGFVLLLCMTVYLIWEDGVENVLANTGVMISTLVDFWVGAISSPMGVTRQ